MKTILLATGNPGKLKEIEALLAQAPSAWRQQITLALPQQFGLGPGAAPRLRLLDHLQRFFR